MKLLLLSGMQFPEDPLLPARLANMNDERRGDVFEAILGAHWPTPPEYAEELGRAVLLLELLMRYAFHNVRDSMWGRSDRIANLIL